MIAMLKKGALIIVVMLFLAVAVSAQVSHKAEQVRPGLFGTDIGVNSTSNYTFPGRLGIVHNLPSYNLQVNGSTNLNDTLYVVQGNRVGIGISNPTSVLTVNGSGPLLNVTNGTDTLIFANATNFFINISTVAFGSGGVNLSGNVSLYDGGVLVFADGTVQSTAFSSSAVDGVVNSTAWNRTGTNVILHNKGDLVGIGTMSPNALLYINGTGTMIQATNGTTTALFVNSTYVGIGTDRPKAQLHLNGTGGFLQTISGQLTTLGSTHNSGQDGVAALAVQGHYAYVSNDSSGDFTIYDIFDPTNPTQVGTYKLGWVGDSIAVSGDYVYVGIREIGLDNLVILDVSDPSFPKNLSGIRTGGSILSIAVLGRYAYLLNQSTTTEDSLLVYDIAYPHDPIKVGGVVMGASPPGTNTDHTLFVSGRFAYVGNESTTADGFVIYNISDPTAPSKVGGAVVGAAAVDIYVSEPYAFVLNDSSLNNFLVYNLSNPSSPTHIAGLDVGGSLRGITVAGRYAFVGSTNSGSTVQVIDISTPASPFIAGSVSANYSSIESVGNSLVVAGSSPNNELHIFDMGGIESHAGQFGSVRADNIDIIRKLDVGNSLHVRNSLNVGSGGIYSRGPFAMSSGGNGTLEVFSIVNQSGETTFSIEAQGEVNISSISEDGANKLVCIKADGNLGTCTLSEGNPNTCSCS